jgi:hypothetical protein
MLCQLGGLRGLASGSSIRAAMACTAYSHRISCANISPVVRSQSRSPQAISCCPRSCASPRAPLIAQVRGRRLADHTNSSSTLPLRMPATAAARAVSPTRQSRTRCAIPCADRSRSPRQPSVVISTRSRPPEQTAVGTSDSRTTVANAPLSSHTAGERLGIGVQRAPTEAIAPRRHEYRSSGGSFRQDSTRITSARGQRTLPRR